MSQVKVNTVIRTHIKNEKRLETLERTILSWRDKHLDDLGELYLVDDTSPMRLHVKELAVKYGANYYLCTGEPDTKNGLYHSLKCQNSYPVLCCVDDMVFGEGTKQRLTEILNTEYPLIKKTAGCIGMFACYETPTREINKVNNTELWNIPNEILYALVCHLFTPKLAKILISDWEKIQRKEIPYPCMCDDIWVKEVCIREGILNYNTTLDYAQHTGMRNRSFGEGDGGDSSDYRTSLFVGE
jgi:hypothetical protein